jgi:AraC-like DNA-binding protein
MPDRDVIKKKEGFKGQKAIVLPRKILAERCAKNEIIGNLYITDIGYYPKARYHYRERSHGADQHILIYCHEGSGKVMLRKKQMAIEPGDFVVIPAKTRHAYMADELNPWTIYWIHFTGTAAAHIISELEKSTGQQKGFLRHTDKSLALFNEIYAQLERGYGNDNLLYSNMCLWHYLTTFLFNDNHDLSGEPGYKDEINTAIDFLKKNITQTLTLEEIAGSVNLSPSHFSVLFKKKTGFTSIEYFNHLKVQQACQYLLFTNLRIKEIASELGIEDQYYFSRMFTKVMGMSPNTYREKHMH